MSNPKGMRVWTHALDGGAQVHVYSDDCQAILQMRRAVPTDEDILSPSFKVAVMLTASDALALAAELVSASSRMLAAHESLSRGNPGSADAHGSKGRFDQNGVAQSELAS